MKHGELALLVCFGATGAAAAIGGYDLGLIQFRKPGAGLFPFIVGIFLAIIAFWTVAREVLRLRARSIGPTLSALTIEAGPAQARLRKEILLLLALAAYMAALNVIAFAPASTLLVAVIVRFVGERSWTYTALLSLGIVLPMTLILGVALKMQLPGGTFY